MGRGVLRNISLKGANSKPVPKTILLSQTLNHVSVILVILPLAYNFINTLAYMYVCTVPILYCLLNAL